MAQKVQHYTIWCQSPGAFSNPEKATGINIRVTNQVLDASQKNYEVLVQSIGLRSMPIALGKPEPVRELKDIAPSLSGEGFVWKFVNEHVDVFRNYESKIGLLIEELNGIVLPNGSIIKTIGTDKNIEFAIEE